MPIKMIFCMLFYILLTSLISAQSLQLGLRVEQNLVQTQHNSEVRPYQGSTGLMLNVSVFPIKWLGIEGRAGIVPFIEYYNGLETALFMKYNYGLNYEYLKSVYLAGGYVFHQIAGDSHFDRVGYANTLTMPAVGIGVNLFRGLNLELLYLNGRDTEVGYYFPFLSLSTPENTTHVRVKSVLKFGIGGSFDLFSWKY